MSFRIFNADALDALREMPDNSVDSLVTDPPAGISFMGKGWDTPSGVIGEFRGRDNGPGSNPRGIQGEINDRGSRGARKAFLDGLTPIFEECLRVLKPGAHGIVWALPRTSHWTATALEDAGFEIRDVVTHLFGCLTTEAEVLTRQGWRKGPVPAGTEIMGYDIAKQQAEWVRVERVFAYDYDDTAYRLCGDHSEHVVSRGHGCVVERGGELAFVPIEEVARQREARIPILENLPGLREPLRRDDEGAGDSESLLCPLCSSSAEAVGAQEASDMPDVCDGFPAQGQPFVEPSAILLSKMLRNLARNESKDVGAFAGDCGDGPPGMDRAVEANVLREDERPAQSSVEGWGDLAASSRSIRASALCEMPTRVRADGAQGRIRDGAQACRCARTEALPTTDRGRASRESQPSRQSDREPRAIRDQSRPQALRASRLPATDLVRVERVNYRGMIWCPSVRTQAFVVRENGVPFVTGNSGFPKSLDVSKAIDKAAGAEPTVIGSRTLAGRAAQSTKDKGGTYTAGAPSSAGLKNDVAITRATSDDAKKWEGWGTALKPASEHWIVVRKPLSAKNVAANVLAHGVGALNIDGCRIGTEPIDTNHTTGGMRQRLGGNDEYGATGERSTHSGRWPANVVLSHHPLCEIVGERVIKGDNREPSGADPGGFYDVGTDARATAPSGTLHGDTVAEVWDCVPGCAVAQLDAQSGETESAQRPPSGGLIYGRNSLHESITADTTARGFADNKGGASRFFYVAKPSTDEKTNALQSLSLFDAPDKPFFCACARKPVALADQSQSDHERAHATGFCDKCGGLKSRHPTVKPVELMCYFCRLVTPPGGTILDCFAGSGTTGVAALAEGFNVVLIEREPDYAATVRARCERAAFENGRT